MRIQIVSDLHLEFEDINIQNQNNADVLILSGDIMVASKVNKVESEYGIRFRDFLKRCSFQFPHVIYVAGNHEFYSDGKFFQGLEELRTACAQHANIYFLERDTKVIDDVVFVGGTLWTDMNKYDPLTLHAIRDMMNDYRGMVSELKNLYVFKDLRHISPKILKNDWSLLINMDIPFLKKYKNYNSFLKKSNEYFKTRSEEIIRKLNKMEYVHRGR